MSLIHLRTTTTRQTSKGVILSLKRNDFVLFARETKKEYISGTNYFEDVIVVVVVASVKNLLSDAEGLKRHLQRQESTQRRRRRRQLAPILLTTFLLWNVRINLRKVKGSYFK